jgi:NAD+ diphosphatase
MEMNFCRRCGTALTQKSEGVFECGNGHTLFSAAAPTAGIFFVNENNEVLMSVRGIEPDKGMLDSPGGFVEEHETVEEALVRELNEELGVTPDQYEPPQFLCTATNDYKYQGEARSVMSVFFWSRLKPGVTPMANDDVAEVNFMPLSEINLDEIGGNDVKAAVEKLRLILL